jgi:hypothetical protein
VRQRRGRLLARSVTFQSRTLGSRLRDGRGLLRGRLHHREIELEHDVEACRPQQSERSPQKHEASAGVAAQVRTSSGRGQVPPCALGDVFVRLPELRPVATRLLEVVPENFVQLDQVGAMVLQPIGEAAMELGADRLRQGVIGGVADQEVPEAIGVVARGWGRSGRTSSRRTNAARRDVTSASSGASAWTVPRWNSSPSTAPLRPRHTDDEDCHASGEQSRRLDQVEERLLSPLDVVEADDEWRLVLEQLAKRPRDLVGARRKIGLPE